MKESGKHSQRERASIKGDGERELDRPTDGRQKETDGKTERQKDRQKERQSNRQTS